MAKLSSSLLVLAVGSALISGACDSSDDTQTVTPNYRVYLTRIDSAVLTTFERPEGACQPADLDDASCEPQTKDADVSLHCDGTLAVAAAIAPPTQFLVRPANACGESTRCGYFHFEALDGAGELLSAVDSATTEGVLELDPAQLGELAQIRVVLTRGLDRKPVLDAAGKPIDDTRSPHFIAPTACEEPSNGGGGNGGAGGQPPEPSQGGAGGADAPGGAGAGGASDLPEAGASVGGAGAAGQ